MTADTVVLVGNPRVPSRTRGVADAVADAATAAAGAAGIALAGREALELAEEIGIAFGPEPAYGSDRDTLAVVRAARVLVVATPTYKGTFSGLLKVFLDRFGHRELSGVLAVPVAVAAAPAHAVTVGATLGAVLSELGATVLEPFVPLEPDLGDLAPRLDAWVLRNRAGLVAGLTEVSRAS